MTSTVRLVAGSLASSWTAAVQSSDLTSFNSLAAGSVVVGTGTSGAFDNTPSTGIGNGDLFADVWLSLAGTLPASGACFFPIYLLELGEDGSTYGDGTTTGTVLPAITYWQGSIAFTPTGTSGSKTFVGMAKRILLPAGKFRWGIGNQTQNALAASAAAAVYFRTYAETVNG